MKKLIITHPAILLLEVFIAFVFAGSVHLFLVYINGISARPVVMPEYLFFYSWAFVFWFRACILPIIRYVTCESPNKNSYNAIIHFLFISGIVGTFIMAFI